MIDRTRNIVPPGSARRRDARGAGRARRPAIEALEVRSLLSVAGSPDFAYAFGSTTPGEAIVNYQDSSIGTTESSTTAAQAVDSNGDAVVVGTAKITVQSDGQSSTVSYAAVTRLNPDGTVDTSFGTDGTFLLPTVTEISSTGQAVAIEPDGDIVVAADVVPAGATTFGAQDIDLFRLTPAGAFDTTFGTGGVEQFSVEQGSSAYLYSSAELLAIAPDGDVVVGGIGTNSPGPNTVNQLAIAAFTPGGAPDTSFGTGGQVLPTFTGTYPVEDFVTPGLTGLAIRSSGAIDFDTTVVPGSATSTEYEIAVGQLTPAGAFDTSFGTGGQVLLPGQLEDYAGPLAIQPDGQLVVTGSYFAYGQTTGLFTASSHFDVYRLDPDGAPDTSFGTGGETTLDSTVDSPFGLGNASGNEAVTLLIEPGTGTIFLGGFANTPGGGTGLAINALDSDGRPDSAFGTNGLDLLPYAYARGEEFSPIYGLGLQPDGELLALTNEGTVGLRNAPGADNDFNDSGTSDYAVELTNLAVPIVAYQTASQAATTPANLVAIGIPGAGQTLPAPGAYDGGGIDEVGVYLPAIGAFAYKPFNDPNVDGQGDVIFSIGPTGIGAAIPAPGDYDGSGRTRFGVYDVATGSFIYSSAAGDMTVPFGIPGAGQSIPVPANYYGTGQDDIAVYLAASGVWAIQDPTGKTTGQEIAFGPAGLGSAIPAPADYDNSGHVELGLYLPSIGAFAYLPYSGGPAVITAFGMPGTGNSIPMPGDYDGSGHTELAVYMPTLDAFAYRPYGGGPDVIEAFGAVGASIPFSVAGAEASGGGGAPKAITSGGLDGYVDFVPDLASQPAKKAANDGSSTTTQAQS